MTGFKVGDLGQRYEVTFFDPSTNARRVFGWSASPECAQRMAAAIESHPSWELPQIKDREASSGA